MAKQAQHEQNAWDLDTSEAFGDDGDHDGYTKVDRPPVVELIQGKPVVGIFEGRKIVDMSAKNQKDGNLYTLRSLKGDKKISFWGGAFLVPLMDGVKPGQKVRITFTGYDPAPKKGNPGKLYTVEFK